MEIKIGKYNQCSYLVDAEDYSKVSKHKWALRSIKNSELKYAYNKHSKVWMHRMILNAPKGLLVDHINGNGLDNRKTNLRLCTHSQNMQNRKIHKNNKTGYKGVYWDNEKKRFMFQVRCGLKIKREAFDTPEEAYMGYLHYSKLYFKEFART